MAHEANLTSVKSNTRHRHVPGYHYVDLPFLTIVVILLTIGILMMFSASYATAIDEGMDGTYYAVKQLKMAGIGLAVMYIASYFDYHSFRKFWISGGIFIVALVMLVLVLFVGKSTDTDVTRWLKIGPIVFQPSEIMKFAVVIFFSMLIEKNYSHMHEFKRGILPYFLMLGIIAVLMMMQPHLSGTILILLIGLTLVFVGGAKITQLGGAGLAGCALLVAVILTKKNYFMTRITTWLDPFNEATAANDTWQTCQSLIAIGSGGLFGLGFCESRQKYLYLPETKNDFVFAIVCEELGYVGAVVVILLFALLVFRGFYIASKARDKLGTLLVLGLTMHIGLQAFLNIAVVSNLIPNTGISLPFFSYGGTALIMQLAEMGIILNVSRQANLEK
ncbi:MAG: putative peptidoglycan glycosyltransferase FtsW [Ruminococcus callidus]|nr:putative peptidoglycan glycosyltransferase FtsW [Ruminococcus callidus]